MLRRWLGETEPSPQTAAEALAESIGGRLVDQAQAFQTLRVEDVMTPRADIVAVELTCPFSGLVERFIEAEHSRMPIYRETLDDVVGTVHAKALIAGLRADPAATVETVMRPTFFVPGTREVEDVLADMKRQKVHIAIVLDEYGGTAGLVTMEDLLEEIVGPIYDEYDRAPDAAAAAPDAAPLLSGAAEIREVVLRQTGIRVHTVVFCEKGSLPRTTSGKVRRGEALRLYLAGELPLDKA